MVNYVRPLGPPPGPKPKIYGPDIVWDPKIHHWVKPESAGKYDFHLNQHVRVNSPSRKRYNNQEGEVIDKGLSFALEVRLDSGKVLWLHPDELEGAFEKVDSEVVEQDHEPISWPDEGSKWSSVSIIDLLDKDNKISYEDVDRLNELNKKTIGDVRQAFSFIDIREDDDLHEDSIENALREYAGASAYEINLAMISGRTDSLNQVDKFVMSEMLKNFKPLWIPQSLFRGRYETTLNAHGRPAKPGDVLSVDSFLSTSRNIEVALRFGGASYSNRSEFIEIQTNANSYGITINDVAYTTRPEYETILAPGQYLEIQDVIERAEIASYARRYVKARLHTVDNM